MRAGHARMRIAARIGVGAAWIWGATGVPARPDSGPIPDPPVAEGARLFATDWTRVRGAGDGLGPVFNARSCVACHHLGGPGGAGDSRSDVLILTDIGSPRRLDGTIDNKGPADLLRPLASRLLPNLAAAPSQVLHHFSTTPGYASWRARILQRFGIFGRDNSTPIEQGYRVRASTRNTPALFGAGLIDAIPEMAILAGSLRPMPDFPEIEGRVGRLEDGRIGRFGWKAQTASLDDFVRVACANELGLENPGHAQSPDPLRPGYQAPGIDLTDAECSALTDYVAALPRPVEPTRPSAARGLRLDLGRLTFEGAGCAGCHAPKLGEVAGIYSDLLLHDLGPGLSDSGEYYGSADLGGLGFVRPKGNEWRTPPLWGLRDSGPYLHDGRAATVRQAIALHGGEAAASAVRYQHLDRERRAALDEFLLSLAAPSRATTDAMASGPSREPHRR